MTLNELKEQVIGLGFETDIEDGQMFFNSVFRAVQKMYTDRGVETELKLLHSPQKPLYHIKYIRYTPGGNVRYGLFGEGLYFKTLGTGRYTLTGEGSSVSEEFSGEREHRIIVDGYSEIIFEGEFEYSIWNLALYPAKVSDNPEDIIPPTESVEYRMEDYCDDFLGFSDLARDGNGLPIKGASLVFSTAKIPVLYEGEVRIKYRRCPKSIDTDINAELPIPNGWEHLLAELCASYIWLDDDPEKAQYYLALYNNGMNTLKYLTKDRADTPKIDVLRWT